jgi:hypothetical protein
MTTTLPDHIVQRNALDASAITNVINEASSLWTLDIHTGHFDASPLFDAAELLLATRPQAVQKDADSYFANAITDDELTARYGWYDIAVIKLQSMTSALKTARSLGQVAEQIKAIEADILPVLKMYLNTIGY